MDIKLVETHNGGDVVKTKKDLEVIDGFGNMVYLAMFGGNVDASTPSRRLATEQQFSWWGNTVFMDETRDLQLNSETERALRSTPLTSSGRLIIEQAIRNDLKFMKQFAKIAVAVKIVATDVVVIGVHVEEPDNTEAREFAFIWDATRNELEETEVINKTITIEIGGNLGLDYIIDWQFI